MKTKRIKVTDLQTLQMEKQRLSLQLAYTEEQIVEKSGDFFYNLPVHLVSYILPFGLGQKPVVVKWIRKAEEFLSGNVFTGSHSNSSRQQIYKVLLRAAKTFVVKTAGKMFQKKKIEEA